MRSKRTLLARVCTAVLLPATLAACGSTVSLGQSGGAPLTDSGLGGAAPGKSSTAVSGAGSVGALTGTSTGSTTQTPSSSATGAPSSAMNDLGGAAGAGSATPLKPIKLGYVVFDTAGFTAVTGNSDAGQNSSANQDADHFEMQTLVKYANATGGVNGRTIAPPIGYRLSTTDALNQQTLASTCAKATEDDKVQAFIDRSFMITDDLVTCFAKHKVNLVSFLVGSSDEILKLSSPYVATTQPSIERTAKAFVGGILSSGYLTKGAVVGVVADEGKAQDAALNDTILPALKQAGFQAKVVSRTSSTDNSSATSQGSAAVLKMRSSGVTHVVWFANFLSQLGFANAASSQGYKPRYAWSDYAGGVGDAGFYISADQNRNSIAVSVLDSYVVDPSEVHHTRSLTDPIDRPKAAPGLRRCLDIFKQYGGRDYYKGGSGRSTDYRFLCDHFLLWLDGARLAPKPFATALFATGVHALGTSFMSVLAHDTDFAIRLSGASDYRVGLYAATGCKCWAATTPWLRF